MKHDGRQSAEYSFRDNLKTDLLRCLFFVPAVLLIAAVLCRRWIFAIAAAAAAGLPVWLLLRGDRCPPLWETHHRQEGGPLPHMRR